VRRTILKKTVRLDPKFALAWACSHHGAIGYRTTNSQPKSLFVKKHGSKRPNRVTLKPNLGEGRACQGIITNSCLKAYENGGALL